MTDPFRTRTFFFVGTRSRVRRPWVTFITVWSILVHILLLWIHLAINTRHFPSYTASYDGCFDVLCQKETKTQMMQIENSFKIDPAKYQHHRKISYRTGSVGAGSSALRIIRGTNRTFWRRRLWCASLPTLAAYCCDFFRKSERHFCIKEMCETSSYYN